MTGDGATRSVFAGVDQDKVLHAFDAAIDDGLDSDFFPAMAMDAGTQASGSAGEWRTDPARRRTFILHGPGAFA